MVGARRASDVKRYHTFPIVGEQTNGHHAYNMAAMLLFLYPTHSARLMKLILLHDGAEDVTGDLPSPSMWGNAALKAEYDLAQYRVAEERYDFSLEHLTQEEADWLHALDKLEALIFGFQQCNLGNCNGEYIAQNVKDWFGKQIEADRIPQPVLEYYALIMRDNEVA